MLGIPRTITGVLALLAVAVAVVVVPPVHASPIGSAIVPPPPFAEMGPADLRSPGPACSVRAIPLDGALVDRACAGDTGATRGVAGVTEALSLDARATIQTPRGTAAVAPLAGPEPDAFALVHRLGDVGLFGGDGSLLWARPSMTFFEDWGLTPAGRAPAVLLPPMINPFDTSTDPLNALTLRGDPYDVGDLTGDGVEEIAVGHFAVLTVDELGGTTASTAAVTVLDGSDGSTLWWRLYPGYVTQLLLAGETLLVGSVSGNPSGGAGTPGATSRLEAVRFSVEDGVLTGATAWEVDTGVAWARWFDLEPAGAGRVAASWSAGSPGSGGRVVLLDASSGTAIWTATLAGFPRALRYDAGRDQVVVHEQASPSSPPAFTVSGLRAADGSVAATLSASAAGLSSLEVADVGGSPGAEWVLGEFNQVQGNTFWPATVRAVDPESGATLWADTRGTRASPSPVPQTIRVVPTPAGQRVVVASVVIDYGKAPVKLAVELRGYVGSSGAVAWSRQGDPVHGDDPAHPAFPVSHVLDGRPVVVTSTTSIAVRAYDAVDGAPRLQAPTLAEPLGVMVADANEDATLDLIVGTEGGGVFALDGADLDSDPGILWWAATGGPVRTIEMADLDGDGRDEVVAATTNGVEALDLGTGERRVRLEYPDDYVFTLTLGDVSGDGRADIVVPTRSVAAYRGTNGDLLWEFPPVRDELTALYFSNARVTPQGDVAVQLIEHSAWRTPSTVNTLLAGPYVQRHFLATLEGVTGRPRWIVPTDSADRPTYLPLWRAVAPGPDGPGAPSTVHTYERQDQFPSLTGAWRPGLYAHDAATGQELWRGRGTTGVVHMGTVARGGRAVQINWNGLLSAGPEGTWEVDVGATSDIADAELGPLGRAFLTNWDGHVHVFPADAADGPGEPELLAERPGLTAGRLLAGDLDGDGVDEIVTYGFDWVGYTQISAISGALVIRFDATPHGIEILEVRER